MGVSRPAKFRVRFIAVSCLGLLFQGQMRAVETDGPDEQPRAAVSADGRYRLSLVDTAQEPSPWDAGKASISAHFRLESRTGGSGEFVQQLPEGVFLDNVEVEAAELPSGKDVAGEKVSKWVDSSVCSVVIQHLEAGAEQPRLTRLKLAVTLVKVTDWELLEFKGIQKADERPLHCGPFELVVAEAEAKHVSVSAAAFSEHAKEHEAYRQKMPLKFLTHRYATQELRLTDSAGKRLGFSAGTFTGGGSMARYAVHADLPLIVPSVKKTAGDAPPSFWGPAEDIRYPVTAGLKLPGKYVSERVMFEFRDVNLPPLKKRN